VYEKEFPRVFSRALVARERQRERAFICVWVRKRERVRPKESSHIRGWSRAPTANENVCERERECVRESVCVCLCERQRDERLRAFGREHL